MESGEAEAYRVVVYGCCSRSMRPSLRKIFKTYSGRENFEAALVWVV
jgi:hypothetical protein